MKLSNELRFGEKLMGNLDVCLRNQLWHSINIVGSPSGEAEQSNARDFGPLSPVFAYSSRITVWWQFRLGCPSSGAGQNHVIAGVSQLWNIPI